MANVRRAIEFRLEDFENLSKHTFDYIRNCQIRNQVVPEGYIVLRGRRMAYDPRRIEGEWAAEFVPALDAAGFIRHDIGPDADWRTFAVASFYESIYMSTPRQLSLICNKLELLHSNENYENFQHITDEQFEEVCRAIARQITPEEWEIVKLCGGFTGEAVSWNEAARRLNLSPSKVHSMFVRTMKRLKNKSQDSEPFPPVFVSSKDQKAKVEELTRRLAKLHEHPIFAEEAKLKATIKEISAKIQSAASSGHPES